MLDIAGIPGDKMTRVKVKQSLYRPIAGPEGSRRLRLSDFKTMLLKMVRLSAVRTGLLYPHEIFVVLISLRD